ncbi:MAG: glycosyltransferase [Gemmatimonadota bacterium]|nr:glycosyltransferase [Gemmatimonadota bacterium]
MTISVVVASFRDRRILDACMDALLPQCERIGAELIVSRADHAAGLEQLAKDYPAVRVISVAKGTGIPQLRGAGLATASGDIVALTEDHCVPAENWVSTFAAYANTNVDVVGGGMDNARTERALEWGAFFAEYGFFSAVTPRPPQPEGTTLLLTGANVAYARRVLGDVVAWTLDGAWENVVHDRLRAAGAKMVFDRAARVGQNLMYSLGAFCADRFQHGHDYARVRLALSPGQNRWVRIAASLALPPVLTLRVARTAIGSRTRAVAFLRALPFTFAFLAAWSAGEAVGYLRGPSAAPQLSNPS